MSPDATAAITPQTLREAADAEAEYGNFSEAAQLNEAADEMEAAERPAALVDQSWRNWRWTLHRIIDPRHWAWCKARPIPTDRFASYGQCKWRRGHPGPHMNHSDWIWNG